MRAIRLLIILLLVSSFGAYSQVANPNTNTNSNSNANTPVNTHSNSGTNLFNNASGAEESQPVMIESKSKASKSRKKEGTEKKEVLKSSDVMDASGAGIYNLNSKSEAFSTMGMNFNKTYQLSNSQTTRRSPTKAQQSQMDEVVKFYENADPNSFEYHYFKYLSGNYNTAWFEHLQKARELRPNNLDVTTQLAAYHVIMNQNEALKQDLGNLLHGGKLDQELLTYGKHLLNSVGSGGVLLTHGFEDSYAAWYMRYVMAHRSDVKVISIDLLQSEQLRKNLEADGFKVDYTGAVDVAFLQRFCQQNANRNIYLSMTIPKPYLQTLVNDLQIQGLSFVYGQADRDVFPTNEALWNDLKTNRELYVYTDEAHKKMSSNYLPFLFYMKKTYQSLNQPDKEKEVDKAIEKVSIQCNMKEKVKGYGY